MFRLSRINIVLIIIRLVKLAKYYMLGLNIEGDISEGRKGQNVYSSGDKKTVKKLVF